MEEHEYIPEAHSATYFHGECWYRCPHCRLSFEYYDAVYERMGIKAIGNRTYICPDCKKKFKIN